MGLLTFTSDISSEELLHAVEAAQSDLALTVPYMPEPFSRTLVSATDEPIYQTLRTRQTILQLSVVVGEIADHVNMA